METGQPSTREASGLGNGGRGKTGVSDWLGRRVRVLYPKALLEFWKDS